MSMYEFTLRFTLPSAEIDMEDVADRLYGGGCDDALVGIGYPGTIALDFTREAVSAQTAVMSAIADVVGSIPDSVLVEVAPDLVGVTDVSALVGCSRQNIRQLMMSSADATPTPVHVGKQSLWHLAPVLSWLAHEKQYSIGQALLDLAATTMRINTALDALSADPDTERELRKLFAS